MLQLNNLYLVVTEIELCVCVCGERERRGKESPRVCQKSFEAIQNDAPSIHHNTSQHSSAAKWTVP